MRKINLKLSLLTCFLAVTACSSAPTVTEISNNADPNVEMARVEENITRARNQQVDVLSPKNFEMAADTMDKAKEARGKNKDQKEVLHKIALSQAYLDKANQSANVAGQVIPGVVKERKDALTFEAPKYYPGEFSTIDDDLKVATRDIESNDTGRAEKYHADLENRYTNLGVQSLKKAKLGDARSTVEQAVKEGAKKLTPQTFAWTEKKINDEEAIILNERHNPAVVEKASAEAKTAAARLLNLVREAKNATQQTPEQLAAQLEKDRLAVEAVSAASGEKLNQTKEELAQTNAELMAKKEHIAELSAQNEKLESKGQLEEKYEAARQLFSKEEAEVYKQGDKILLRLKGLSFPKDQAIITTSNYPLLTKVQTVIKNSNPEEILIEGHTDSTGSKATNEKLSAARAESVESYLKANDLPGSVKMTAQGYGDSKPIASNKTAVGRAQNRRVDIIITAEPAK